ncbi:MAG: YbjN domain-containing protein [Acidimicrobiia bacterium]|nr:YbjN domain-containing protein [Acidimicrobiia bacterium]
MNEESAWGLLTETTLRLVADDGSDVVNAEEYEGRWAVRMAQQTRDFTTVWFDVGERTVGFEAYVLPNPPGGHQEVYRQLLSRNQRMWRTHFAIDRDGDVFLVGRVPLSDFTPTTIDEVLGAVYEAVELSFRSLIEAGFGKR